ncbi:lipoprotein signal peptidase [Luteibaculum oceani]|uniref:Lipoprotein signal peptidase n=1 Tax=Luteibaculum oceani TaxID=1294296 RepID=A0A5C6VPS8_9FLAO|nr:lipoprotein signal peptidase [Luteibaculum oceani]TXC85338.1 lipoprotein signal peptidase [Luteibaculum oceani]
MRLSIIIISAVLLVDQISKFWIKLSMHYGESISVFGDWFYIHFIENPGMAFGLAFGGTIGKVLLTLFRFAAIIAIGYYLFKKAIKLPSKGFIIAISLIFAGALGNLIDSLFYGVIFSASSPYNVAEFLPEAGGYGKFLQGKVVDMLYFPIVEGHWPNWVPFVGGDYMVFFRPIFNIADTAISVGVGMLILFQKKYLTTN